MRTNNSWSYALKQHYNVQEQTMLICILYQLGAVQSEILLPGDGDFMARFLTGFAAGIAAGIYISQNYDVAFLITII